MTTNCTLQLHITRVEGNHEEEQSRRHTPQTYKEQRERKHIHSRTSKKMLLTGSGEWPLLHVHTSGRRAGRPYPAATARRAGLGLVAHQLVPFRVLAEPRQTRHTRALLPPVAPARTDGRHDAAGRVVDPVERERTAHHLF